MNDSWVCAALFSALAMGCGGDDGAGSAEGLGGGGHGSATATGGASGAGSGGAKGCDRFATESPDHEFGPGQSTGQASFPQPLFGPPKGAGDALGSLDVVSLGNGGHVTLAFGATRIVDAPGADFIVFENAFYAGGDPSSPFAELGTVSVSADGQSFVEFPCTAAAAPYGKCAGWHPVYANPDENDIDPLDPDVAGGDAFDLADVGLAEARFVKITDRADLTGMNGVFDLDAVAVVHASCP